MSTSQLLVRHSRALNGADPFLGLVGGDIVLQLLQRGESPESIRVVDFVPLNRRDMAEAAAGSDFVQADISSRASVEAAFSKPWPASVAKKPLTVFHTAAAVRPQERSLLLYHRLSAVNRDGAVNVLEAARAAGADIFIATSSASVSIVPPKFWIWPWQSSPTDYFQVANEKDFDSPLRPHDRFFSNCKPRAALYADATHLTDANRRLLQGRSGARHLRRQPARLPHGHHPPGQPHLRPENRPRPRSPPPHA